MNTSLKYMPRSYYWAHREALCLNTTGYLEFIDLTEQVQGIVTTSSICSGMVTIQSMHTTAGVVVNEKEPLLLEDLRSVMERVAPRTRAYGHDDFRIRTVNMTQDEEPNGHAHCKALFLPTSVTLNVWRGRMQVGRWQRLFLVELDRPRARTVSVLVLGLKYRPDVSSPPASIVFNAEGAEKEQERVQSYKIKSKARSDAAD